MSEERQLELAVNEAVGMHQMSRQRMMFGATMGAIDAKRPRAWCEYGFPSNIDFSMLFTLYRRGGVAYGAVNKLIGRCWKTQPTIIEGDKDDNATDETRWERTVKQRVTKKLWREFKEADTRRLVGKWSALLLHINDGGDWKDPVTKRGKMLVDVTPAWASAVTPAKWDDNPASELYGQVTLWNYRETLSDGRQGRLVTVHPSRIFILGDYSSEAIGFLEPAFNSFVSMEKVEGGSGEGFLKNAARQLALNFDSTVDLKKLATSYGVPVEKLHTKFNEAARAINMGIDNLLIGQGMTTTPIVASLPDPSPTYEINLSTAAAALDIPVKILVGNQTGERASTEDEAYFNERCQSRRVSELSYEVERLFTQLIGIGVVDPIAEFTCMWDDLTTPTKAQRLANSKTLAEISSSASSGGLPAFSVSEIRTEAGFPAELPEEDLPELPEDDPDADPTPPTTGDGE